MSKIFTGLDTTIFFKVMSHSKSYLAGIGHRGTGGDRGGCWFRKWRSGATCSMLSRFYGYTWPCCLWLWNQIRLRYIHTGDQGWLAGRLEVALCN